ncbi:MAG: hypothetical protein MMC23_001551 [Stictis urceolatum]|nr:hypothetical protein [Stictis urceolata]
MTAYQPKNILLLVADDLGKYVGCYGSKSIRTPNLDKLAAQGTRFDQAFASTASCSGSRSTIYTGLHTHENGQYGLNITKTHFQTFEHIETAPAIFNRAGYQTGIIGKVHVGPDRVYPWKIREESESRDVAWVSDRAEAFFEQAKQEGQPFFLTIGYVDPHRDVTTRSGFGNEEKYDSRIDPGPDYQTKDVEVPSWLTDLPETRQELVAYYKSISRMDAGVGMILSALSRQGLSDSTLVIFTSDNGPPFINSKTTLFDAGISLPLLFRAPGSPSGVVNPNMVSFVSILPTLLDWSGIPETHDTDSLRNGGAPVSPKRLGRSFLPILADESIKASWQQAIYCSHTFHELHQYWPTRVLRTPQFKYHRNVAWRLDFPLASDLYASLTFEGIRNQRISEQGNGQKEVMIGPRSLSSLIFRPAEELFDLDNDPEEVKNVAGDPTYEDKLVVMRKELEAWQKKTRDPWLFRDGGSVVMMNRYRNAGLRVPDRWDFDVGSPATRDGAGLVSAGLDGVRN